MTRVTEAAPAARTISTAFLVRNSRFALRTRRAPTAVYLHPRNGPVLIRREGRRQADAVLRLDVVVGDRQHDHQAINVAEKVLERTAGAPAHHVRAGATDRSAVVVEADDARIGQAEELRPPRRPNADLLQRSVAREVRARCGRRAARRADSAAGSR